MWQGVRKAINNNTKSSNQSEKKAFTIFIVIKSCTEPLRADDIMRSPAATSWLVPDRRPSPYDKRLFIRFETVGINTFDWKRSSFSCPSPFQSLNDLALSRADMIHTTINVGHVMCLQPANFRGLHGRTSFRPRRSVSHVCLAYRGLSWRHVKFAWRKTLAWDDTSEIQQINYFCCYENSTRNNNFYEIQRSSAMIFSFFPVALPARPLFRILYQLILTSDCILSSDLLILIALTTDKTFNSNTAWTIQRIW